METSTILYAALSIGGMGILFGLGLGFAAKKFEVKQDPMIPRVIDLLPGANCGGCGFPGCAALGEAIVIDGVSPTKCPVATEEAQAKLAELLGRNMVVGDKYVAFVKCKGNHTTAQDKYVYDGIKDCNYVQFMQGTSHKVCEFGCLGFGSCVKACQFDAIHIVNGVAVVDEDKCTNCGMCMDTCPKNLIVSVPEKSKVRVSCMSNNKGKLQMDSCQVGCIGCKKCAKVCPVDAITIDNFLATIDYDKCINCGKCVKECPTEAIDNFKKKKKPAVTA